MDDYLNKKLEQMRLDYHQRKIKIPPRYNLQSDIINCRCITEDDEEEVVIDYNKIYKILKDNE